MHAAAAGDDRHQRRLDGHPEPSEDDEMIVEDVGGSSDGPPCGELQFELVDGAIVHGSSTDQFGLVDCDIYVPNSQWPGYKGGRSRCRVHAYAEKAPSGPSYVVSCVTEPTVKYALTFETLADVARKCVPQPSKAAAMKLQGTRRSASASTRRDGRCS